MDALTIASTVMYAADITRKLQDTLERRFRDLNTAPQIFKVINERLLEFRVILDILVKHLTVDHGKVPASLYATLARNCENCSAHLQMLAETLTVYFWELDKRGSSRVLQNYQARLEMHGRALEKDVMAVELTIWVLMQQYNKKLEEVM